MPALLYGTAWKAELTTELVCQALDAGFRGIDTACQPKHYNEAQVGEAMRRAAARGISRKQVFLQTKFTPLSSQDPERLPYDAQAPVAEQVAQSFACSQRNLGTEYVDSWILHSPIHPYAEMLQAWRAMEAVHGSGGARQLGISNCYDLTLLQALYAEAEVKPAVVQNRFYQQTAYDQALRAWCLEHEMIYQSFWTLTANAHLLENPFIQSLSQQYAKTPAQVLFRYLHQQGVVPLTGTRSSEHMRQDLDIFNFQLSSAETTQIDALLTGV